MAKQNRNNVTESIRVPIHVIDMVKAIGEVKGLSFQDTLNQIMSEWIEMKKKKLNKGY
jgi:hypothetical protein